jgi:LysR family transcriptional regulator, benzoate and cis,cis-muconate-responsive activator of ben and cat genes
MIDFSMRELESFMAVAEELSFTRAAARLRLAQPPLSRHVRSLEERLGVRLFERTNRTVSLTVAGRVFYGEIREPLLSLQRASTSAKRAASGVVARLELGFVSSLLGPELTELFRSFRVSHPDVQLMLQDRTSADQSRAISEGRLDGGFVGVTPRPRVPGLTLVPWRREALALFVPREHRFAEQRQIALKALKGEPMVAIAAESSPGFASKIHDLCRVAGFRPRIVQEATRAQAVAAMVAAGSGIAILPLSMHRVTGEAVRAVRLAGRGVLVTYLFAHRSGSTSRELTKFVLVLSAAAASRGVTASTD